MARHPSRRCRRPRRWLRRAGSSPDLVQMVRLNPCERAVSRNGDQTGSMRSETDRAAAMVLVVEDEVALSDIVQAYLMKAGYATASARSGPEAVEVTRTVSPDVIVLDLGLPGIDCLEVMRRIRASDDRREVAEPHLQQCPPLLAHAGDQQEPDGDEHGVTSTGSRARSRRRRRGMPPPLRAAGLTIACRKAGRVLRRLRSAGDWSDRSDHPPPGSRWTRSP